jgi:FKBP-type peptidyl-prolyl cis-trans isomerase
MNYKKIQQSIILIALSITLFSCGGENSSADIETEAEKVYTETEFDIQISTYLESNDWETQRTETGLYLAIENEGGEEKPTVNDYLTVKYTAVLLNGVVFDDTKGNPIQFPFPVSDLIPGWQEGLSYLGKGGKGKFIIPPNLAFGDQVSGPIPANSAIVIDIELIDFQPAPPVQATPVALADYSVAIEKYMADNEIEGAIKTKEGMYIKIEEEGSSEKPTVSNNVTIQYKGYLLDHTVFDQTDGDTRTFPLGGLIAGWQIGIPYIGKGGKCKLIIPPHIGYGANAMGDIPANSILVFDIELDDFN